MDLYNRFYEYISKNIGVEGFEPPTYWSQTSRASQAALYPGKKAQVYDLSVFFSTNSCKWIKTYATLTKKGVYLWHFPHIQVFKN